MSPPMAPSTTELAEVGRARQETMQSHGNDQCCDDRQRDRAAQAWHVPRRKPHDDRRERGEQPRPQRGPSCQARDEQQHNDHQRQKRGDPHAGASLK